MELILFVLFLLLIILTGLNLVSLFGGKSLPILELLTTSFHIGLGFSIIFVLICSLVLEIREALMLFFLIVGAFSFINYRLILEIIRSILKLRLGLPSNNFIKNNLHIFALSFVLGFIILGVTYRNSTWPVVDWDALTSYDFVAKTWYQTDSLNPYGKGFNILDPNLGRPPFTSFMHIYSYLIFGLGEQAKLFYSLLFAFLAIIVYYNFRESLNKTLALFGTIAVITTPFLAQAQSAYTNFPFAAYFLVAIIYLQKWISNKKPAYLFIGVLCFIASIWVRQEFYPFHVLTGIVMVILGYKDRRLVVLGLILVMTPFLQQKIWRLIADYHLGLINPEAYLQFFSEKGQRLNYSPPTIENIKMNLGSNYLYRFWETAPFAINIFISTIGWYFVVFLLSILVSFKKVLEKNLFIGLWIPSAIFVFFLGVYVFSIIYSEDWYGIAGSASRMLSFLPAIIVYYFFKVFDWDKFRKDVVGLINYTKQL